MVDLRQLRYFVAVARQLHVGHAAGALGLRQPTLSRQIRSLEDALGVSLFERHRAGMRLTAAGRDFLQGANRVLLELDRAIATAGRAGRAEIGPLAIGFFTSLGSGRLRDFLALYRRCWPDVTVTFTEGNHLDQIAAIHDRRLDVAVFTGEVISPRIETMLLWSERLYVALPEDHDLARHEAIEWQMLADEPILARGWESGSLAYNCLVARMAPDRDLPHIDQHFAGRENLIGLVGAGYGVTVVSEAAIGVSYPGVVFRPISGMDAILPVTAAWLPENDNPALRRFLSLLRQQVRSRQGAT